MNWIGICLCISENTGKAISCRMQGHGTRHKVVLRLNKADGIGKCWGRRVRHMYHASAGMV
jgi:hypothetical protein